MVPPTMKVFEQFTGKKETGDNSRLDTERSSAVFGDGTQDQNFKVTDEEKRPPMFPPSEDEKEEEKIEPSVEKVAVAKSKQKKGTNSKVRKKGDAIIQ